MNSKRKGSAGEREFSKLCHDNGFDTCRSEQRYVGGVGRPDIEGLPGIHAEVKRTEKLNIHSAMAQAIHDADGKAIPIVAHRRNRDKWLITMLADDWFEMYGKWR